MSATDLYLLGDLAFVLGVVLAVVAAPIVAASFQLPSPLRSGFVLAGAAVVCLVGAAILGTGRYGLIEGPETFQTVIARVTQRF